MDTTADADPALSPRQIQLAALLVTGATNDQIARELNLSLSGAQAAIRRLLAATNTTSRTQAAIWALEHRVVSSPAGLAMVDARKLAALLAALQPAPGPVAGPSVQVLAADFVRHHPFLTATTRRRDATLPPATRIPPRHEVMT